MSFDLFIFEKREGLKTSVDVFNYMNEFAEYGEGRDYDSFEGSSEQIVNFAKRIFEKFPPLNRKPGMSIEDLDLTGQETYHADYTIGKNGIYSCFSWSVSKQAVEYVTNIAKEYEIGIYNPQSNEAYPWQELEILKYRTESFNDNFADWESIEESLRSIDSTDRGVSDKEPAFISIWFDQNNIKKGRDFIQCTPKYKKTRFFASFLAQKKAPIKSYSFEIMKGKVLYQTEVETKEELLELVKAWCIDRKYPDLSSYKILMES